MDASAARRSPSRPEIRFRTSTAVDGERGRLSGRGFRHRHPRPEHFKCASSNLCALDSATDFWPPIRFPANTFCIRSRRRHARTTSGVLRHQRRRPRPRLPSIPFGRLRKSPVARGTRFAVFNAVDDRRRTVGARTTRFRRPATPTNPLQRRGTETNPSPARDHRSDFTATDGHQHQQQHQHQHQHQREGRAPYVRHAARFPQQITRRDQRGRVDALSSAPTGVCICCLTHEVQYFSSESHLET